MNKKLRQVILKGYLSLLESSEGDGRLFKAKQKTIKRMRSVVESKKDISLKEETALRTLLFKLYELEDWDGNCNNLARPINV